MRMPINTGMTLMVAEGEFGYQDVIDDFENASLIRVITFNISSRENTLIQILQEMSENKDVKIITNIPNRYENYTSVQARNRARRNIDTYLQELENSNNEMKVLFNFNNHSKIILTNNIAYIGSQNYSEESSNNIETGILFTNATIVQNIIDEVLPIFEENSIEYYGGTISSNMVLMTELFINFERIYNQLFTKILVTRGDYFAHPHHNIEDADELMINWQEGYIYPGDVEELEGILYDIQDVIPELIENINVGDSVDIGEVSQLIEYIEDGSQIKEFSEFSEQEYANEYITRHSTEITEDNLDEYAEKASEVARNKYDELLEGCADVIYIAKEKMEMIYVQLEEVMRTISELYCNQQQIRNV